MIQWVAYKMSYLLKALERAEEERLNLEVESTDAPQALSQKESVLPVWMVLIVITLLGVTIWKLFEPSGSEVLTLTAQSKQAVSDAPDPIMPAQKPALVVKDGVIALDDAADSYELKNGEVFIIPSSSVVTENNKTPSELLSLKKPVSNKANNKAKQLAELSRSELNMIPSLALESHLFSSVAKYSSVVINGGTYVEGDYINADIIIKKINAEGILISLGNLLVELPKGITWVSNKHVK